MSKAQRKLFRLLKLLSEKNNEEEIRSFLDNPRLNINCRSKKKARYTPLMIAASRGYHSVVSLLIEKGANIEAKDSSGQTAAAYAPKKNHEDIVFLLDSCQSTSSSSSSAILSRNIGFFSDPSSDFTNNSLIDLFVEAPSPGSSS